MIHHEAQEIQEAKKEVQAETDKSAEVSNKESKAVALKAQQAAIKERPSANNLSDTSQKRHKRFKKLKKKHKQRQ